MGDVTPIRPRGDDGILRLQDRVGSIDENLVTHMRRGRYAVSTVGPNPNVQLISSDPYTSISETGLWVPPAPTTSMQTRYLFQLARAGFHNTERVRIVGLKLYASLVATATTADELTYFFELPITTPMWKFPNGGNVSWHVRLLPKGWRDTRSTLATDGTAFRDSHGPALLFETPATPGPYVPPNAGRPYGKAIPFGDLGNFHDLRYPWRDSQSELELDIPIPPAHDVAVYASVWQHDPAAAATGALDATQIASLTPEDQWTIKFQGSVQYGRVAAQIVFEEEIAK
jgi:hypothetical protein